MDFTLTEEQRMIVQAARDVARDFPPEYWREVDQKHEFPEEYRKAAVEAGFLGTIIPEKYGGAGLGMLDMCICIEALSSGGCGISGMWTIGPTAIFGTVPITRHGSKAQKEKYLPRMASGELEFCMGLTEPDAGSNTLNTQTTAVKEGDEYIINGRKVFITNADRAGGMLLITRTTPLEEAASKIMGLTLFLVDLPDPAVEVVPIPKHGLHCVNSCDVFIDDLRVSEDDILGKKGKGWLPLLDVLNPERVGVSAGVIGCGFLALGKAVDYAKKRKVFGRPIGAHQAIQFPLATAKAKLETARLMTYKAAWLMDNGKECMAETSMAKLMAVEAGEYAVYHAMQTFGGYGYAVEYDIERWWREVNLWRLAPVTQEMTLAGIGQHVLGLPSSY